MDPRLLPPLGPALRILHLGGYWRRDNDTVRHMLIGLRQAGATVFEYSTDEHRDALDTEDRRYDRGTSGPVWLRDDHLVPVLRDVDPHLVVCNAGGLAFRPQLAARVRRQRSLIGVSLSDPAVFEPTTRHIARHFDRFLTNHPPSVNRYRSIGAVSAALRFGTNPEFFRPVAQSRELRCDVLVMGHAHEDRVRPVQRLIETFETHVYGEGWDAQGVPSRGLIFGDRSLAALASAACVVVFHRGLRGDPLIKPSLFDFTAAGALVVTNLDAAVEPYFTFGEELAGFGDEDDLVDTVASLLRSPDHAERIRRAGRARTLRDHTWAASWRVMLSGLA